MLIVFSFLILFNLSAQPAPKYEVRAAWITAVYGLDWPRTKATTPAGIQKQKEELVEILDKLKEANFNTVLFQARTRGDVLYKSDIEPYNSILTAGRNRFDQAFRDLTVIVGDIPVLDSVYATNLRYVNTNILSKLCDFHFD